MKNKKTKILAFFISSFFLFGLTGITNAADYYVSPSGSDSDPGTSEKPFKTIQKAADVVVAGDTVIVRDGVYSDYSNKPGVGSVCVHIHKKHGTPDNWITFKSENLHGAVIDGRSGATRYGFYLYYKDAQDAYVRMEGFEIRDFGSSGIQLRSPKNVMIYNNKIHGMGRDYYDAGCTAGGDPIAVGIGSREDTYNVIVDSNIIYDIGRHYNPACGYGEIRWDQNIYVKGFNWVIKNNILYNAHFGWLLKIDRNTNPQIGCACLVSNNVFAHAQNQSNGGHIAYVRKKLGDYVIIQNNVSYDPPGSSYDPDGSFIDNRVALNSDDIFRNNVGSENLYTHKPSGAGTGSGTPTMSNNITNLSLADFHLTDPANNDFTLTPSATHLIDKGTSTNAPVYDFTGAPRPQGTGHDIGAYEFGDAPTPTCQSRANAHLGTTQE